MTIKSVQFGLALAAALSLTACDKPKVRTKPPGATARAKFTPTPPAPAWAASLMGKGLRDAFPKTGACIGNTDVVQLTYAGSPAGVQIHGWGWDLARKARVERVVLVDKDLKIVGAGAGGVARPDVPQNAPQVTDGSTGWNADAPIAHGRVDAYGVLAPDTVCGLGHLEF